jgi:predicted enzyme related to lactoylglutathione lyase
MLSKRGKNVAALYTMPDEMINQGVQPFWLSYISVNNAEKTAGKVKGFGGKVIQKPMDVMDAGRMALIQDPSGAVFALWQPKQNIGAQLIYEPGSFCWNELYTSDPKKVSKFYTALFGWVAKKMKGAEGGDYIEFVNGDQSVGGMLEIQKEWGDIPPNWGVYFAVKNCDATLEKAKKLKGNVETQPMSVEDVGKFAVLQDPQGAHFAIIQLAEG